MMTNSTLGDFARHLRESIRRKSQQALFVNQLADAESEQEFNHLAIALFRLQFANNLPYRKFCQRRDVSPDAISHWSEIPASSTAGFKEVELTSLAIDDRTTVFHSSGTTEQRPSRHFHNAES